MSANEFDGIIKRIFEAAGIESQTDLARILKVNRSAVTQARKKGAVPERWLLRLYRAYGINPEWLETGRGHTFVGRQTEEASAFKKIPKVSARLCAGNGSFEVGGDVQNYYAFRRAWLNKRGASDEMVLLDIFGNSMEPEMHDGDTVLIDQSQKNILAGAVFALGIEDTIMVKRVEKHPNKLVLRSDNKDYAPIYLEGDEADQVRILGKVIWVCREIR
ncbi:MAG: helix-turn-helix domain-containing protein [Deltaproteobacteria bacterium]|jgi:phage repressor protein C with HTH and peptisase S24 domain|nr:helix-turn-helix domain-containing protein [Deltaproteobacteria bacterium]